MKKIARLSCNAVGHPGCRWQPEVPIQSRPKKLLASPTKLMILYRASLITVVDSRSLRRAWRIVLPPITCADDDHPHALQLCERHGLYVGYYTGCRLETIDSERADPSKVRAAVSSAVAAVELFGGVGDLPDRRQHGHPLQDQRDR
jgi:hypothetical protein